MKVFYFYENNTGGSGFYSVRLYALKEETVFSSLHQRDEKSYTYVEKIRLFISNDLDRFHSSKFEIDFGKNSCTGISAISRKEMMKRMTDDTTHHATPITRKQYERLRKFCFAVYQKCQMMDFDLVEKAKQQGRITKIWETA